MKVVCPNCEKTYTIREERLEEGARISFYCPACKEGLIIVDPEIIARFQTPGDLNPPSPPREELVRGDALKRQVLEKLHDLPPMPETV
ncbi:MAG: hypothetical protein GY859_35035, partial [Desulfobacterales bacterium]|nr:hypothetical protein [Desulfobacterales bacterium]